MDAMQRIEAAEREQIMKQWDYWRQQIAGGDKSSGPRDWFESVLDAITSQEVAAEVGKLGRMSWDYEANCMRADENGPFVCYADVLAASRPPAQGVAGGVDASRGQDSFHVANAETCRVQGVEPPLIGRWHHGQGHLVSGSIRISRWDCDTNPPVEFRDRLLDWMCATLNAAVNDYERRAFDGPDTATQAQPSPHPAVGGSGGVTVRYGKMPESCGRNNWTARLVGNGEDFTLDRSEYPHRVRYAADCVRHIIGELPKRPSILDYDADERTPCHLCGGSGEKDGKPCWGLKFNGTAHNPTPNGRADVGEGK